MTAVAHIVCIDDDLSISTHLTRDLSNAAVGYRISCAASGREAESLIASLLDRDCEIPLIICSHVLPDMCSHALLSSLEQALPAALTILLTDHRIPPPITRYAAVFRTIAKPWRLEDLLFTVSGALENYQHQRQLERHSSALEASNQQLQAFIARTPDGILTMTADGVIQSVNAAVSKIFGYSTQDLVGADVGLLMTPEMAKDHPLYLVTYQQSRRAHVVNTTREVMGQRADGSPVPLEVTVFDFMAGDELYFSAILRDLSERRRAEQLAQEKALAEKQAAAKSSFLATMSHEIRTPMNGVLGTLELLEATGLSNEQAGLLGICQDSAHYLLTIIDDILDFSKIDAGKLQFDLMPSKLDDVVFSVAELLSSRAWSKDLELVTFVDNALPGEVICDPARIRQILINLVGNAIKFTHQGQVSIKVRPLGPSTTPGELCRIRFEVTDTGIGLTEDQVGRLFRPFEQAEAGTTRRFGGTGLGLAISRRLVEMMNGQIGVTASLGEGSTFWFEIPFTIEAPPAPRLRLNPVRVLLVAANPIFRDAMERGLSAAGTRVDTVERFSYVPGLIAEASSYDPYVLVVVEDGCAAVHGAYSGEAQLRDPRIGNVPVLLMARRDRGPIGTVLKTTGASYGLSRPARPGLLIKTVAVAIGQEPASILEGDGIGARAEDTLLDESSLRFNGGRVLVAEDTPTSLLVLTKMLQRMGIDPVVAEDGAKAWDILQTQTFDLLITDGHMPEMDGFQLTEAIRANEMDGAYFCASGQEALPIVALSAGVTEEEKARCHAVGMDGFLAKPVESKKLRKALLAFLPPECLPSSTAESTQRPASMSAGLPQNSSQAAAQTAARCGQPIHIPMAPVPVSAVPERAAPLALDEPEDGLKVLDLAVYYELFGGIGDDVRSLLNEFLRSADVLSQEIATHQAAQDSAALTRAAHRLAGAALTAGATELGTLCRTLENALKSDCSWDAISAQSAQISESLDRVRAAISAV